MLRGPIWPLLAAFGLCLAHSPARAGDDAPQAVTGNTAAEGVDTQQTTDAKAIFGAQCGWCHGDYGMQAAKGPRLAGTMMTEPQVEQRIRNGKPGYMPSFRKALDDGQIAMLAKYIKSLKPQD
jgi:mono/diheme cytochrome c family protein